MLGKQKREINSFIQMICGIIAITESVTLLSSEKICGIIAISKSIIILSLIRGSFIFEGNLWIITISASIKVLPEYHDISKYKMIICTISENAFLQGLSRQQNFPKHYLSNICKYIAIIFQGIE